MAHLNGKLTSSFKNGYDIPWMIGEISQHALCIAFYHKTSKWNCMWTQNFRVVQTSKKKNKFLSKLLEEFWKVKKKKICFAKQVLSSKFDRKKQKFRECQDQKLKVTFELPTWRLPKLWSPKSLTNSRWACLFFESTVYQNLQPQIVHHRFFSFTRKRQEKGLALKSHEHQSTWWIPETSTK